MAKSKKKTKSVITNVVPVILSGGSGTRLWPLSRSGFPKQFLTLSGNDSLFQRSIKRLNNISSATLKTFETIIITGEEHRFIALEQVRELKNVPVKLILEPSGKNTAPALTLSALEVLKDKIDPVLVVLPADQDIKNDKAFGESIKKGIRLAKSGSIVTFGITPTHADTGFGYIKRKDGELKGKIFDVDSFIEKPSKKLAEIYFKNKNFSWNCGIFILKASVWINALKEFRNDILKATEKSYLDVKIDNLFIRPNKVLFNKIPKDSIDYAVIEKCPKSKFSLKVIQLDVDWYDLGTWDSVWKSSLKNNDLNVLKGDVYTLNSQSNLILSNHRLVTAIGVKNLIIIETADAIMVANKNCNQDVKKIVEFLADSNRDEHLFHRKVIRPWGWYDTIDVGENFKVKRIQVNPGATLSLQKHNKRAEHWIVVKGKAEVISGDKLIELNQNESTYIPLGVKHRLSNPTNKVLEIIEVQSGGYLGEDDIVRFDDQYGRISK